MGKTSTTALARRRRRSLQLVSAGAGGFGAFVSLGLLLALVQLTGGVVVWGVVLVAFALVSGAGGGWLFGRAASRMMDEGEDPS